MSERSERLFAALSEIREEKIDEAAPAEGEKRFRWKRWAALAAVLVLVLAAGVGSHVLTRPGRGTENSDAEAPGTAAPEAEAPGAGGPGADGASTFTSYAGPVFPLTLKEADSAITADREITLDFAPWADGQNAADIRVTDVYTLTNTSGQDKTISLLYPFAGELYRLDRQMPALSAGGQRLETVLHAGGYAGSFTGFADAGGTEDGGRWNLMGPGSWEQYRNLLAGGGYQREALADYPDLSDIPAIVYEFTDSQGDGTGAATIQSAFELDYGKTQVLSFGFNGGIYDEEGGRMGRNYFIRDQNDPRYLIVLGDDVRDMTVQGYANGGCNAGDERDFTVTVRRCETSLEDILRKIARQKYSCLKGPGADFDMYFGLMKENLTGYGVLSGNPAERYDENRLDDLDFEGMERVFYLEAEVTIPAGARVTMAADLTREGSYDFRCARTENEGVYGYDLVTKAGSNLTCTRQTALLEDRGQIEIVRQNFGFDLENGVKRVTLDPEQEHYYLEVRGLSEKQ